MDGYILLPPPRTDDDCWPLPCRDYHETWAHQEGEDPCACRCHPPTDAAIQAGLPGQVRGLLPPAARLNHRLRVTLDGGWLHCAVCGRAAIRTRRGHAHVRPYEPGMLED